MNLPLQNVICLFKLTIIFTIFFFEENTVKVPFAVCTLMDEVIFVHFLTTISKI